MTARAGHVLETSGLSARDIAPAQSAPFQLVESPSLLGSLKQAVADLFRPHTVETTVAPLPVKELWSGERTRYARPLSFALHALAVCALVIPTAFGVSGPAVKDFITFLQPPPVLLPPPKTGGGGGGGNRSPRPPSKGVPPRGADKQFVLPVVEARNFLPELVMEPTIIAPTFSELPQFSLIAIGDPNGVIGPPSAGPGTGGGIGPGNGTGVGPGDGPGYGPGRNGGAGGSNPSGAYTVGGGVSAPVLLSKSIPEYSDDARRARIQGTVELTIIVNTDGTVQVEGFSKRLGFGLDQKAVDAVRRWRFQPGLRNGNPVPVMVSVLVTFSLR